MTAALLTNQGNGSIFSQFFAMGKNEKKHTKHKKDKKKQSSSSSSSNSSSSSTPPATVVPPAAPPLERRVFFKRGALPTGSATYRMLPISVLKEILHVIKPEMSTGEDNTPVHQVTIIHALLISVFRQTSRQLQLQSNFHFWNS
jgi:hypothetical protein